MQHSATHCQHRGAAMSVRKREWTTRKGEAKEAWIVDYIDQEGNRHIETFSRKKDADEQHDKVRGEVRQGVHTAKSSSKTVAEAAEDWVAFVKLEGRERSTLDHYRNHVDNHIVPRLGRERLAKLTTPRVNAFRDGLLKDLSRAQAKNFSPASRCCYVMRCAAATWHRTLRWPLRSTPTSAARKSSRLTTTSQHRTRSNASSMRLPGELGQS